MKVLTTMAAATAMLIAGPALAQMNQGQQQQNQQRQQQQSSQRGGQQGQQQGQQQDLSQRIQGTLIDLREVNLQGEQEPHVLAKVQMKDGQTAIIDLGTPSELRQQQVRLNRGQQISATGRQGRINDLPILIVDRYVGDGQFTIVAPVPDQGQQQAMQGQQMRRHQLRGQQMRNRQQQMQAGQWRGQQGQQRMQARGGQQQLTMGFPQQPAQQRGPALVTGELTALRDVQLRGVSDEHRLVKLRTSQGQTIVVDLGVKDQIEDLQLSQGETVAVIGSPGRINGRPVLFADQVADITRIDRSQEQQQQGQQQQGQQQQQQSRQQQNRQQQQ